MLTKFFGVAPFVVAVACLSATGCSEHRAAARQPMPSYQPHRVPLPRRLPPPERSLELLAPAGFAEDGSTDVKVDWVTPFERETGCRVRATTVASPDDVVAAMRKQPYDGVLARGEVALRLVAQRAVVGLNARLVPELRRVPRALRAVPGVSFRRRPYGVPVGIGATMLLWRRDLVSPPPRSWRVVLIPAARYRGKVSAQDTPMAIAAAALFLARHRPQLQIHDPYELDPRQFHDAVALLKIQHKAVGAYWSDYTKQQDAFASGNAVIGSGWPLTASLLQAERVPVRAALPIEGTTGWVDAWFVGAHARHVGCLYRWLAYSLTPRVNAAIARWIGETPANPRSCRPAANRALCRPAGTRNARWYRRVAYAKLPLRECGDLRGPICMGYRDWKRAWADVRG